MISAIKGIREIERRVGHSGGVQKREKGLGAWLQFRSKAEEENKSISFCLGILRREVWQTKCKKKGSVEGVD